MNAPDQVPGAASTVTRTEQPVAKDPAAANPSLPPEGRPDKPAAEFSPSQHPLPTTGFQTLLARARSRRARAQVEALRAVQPMILGIKPPPPKGGWLPSLGVQAPPRRVTAEEILPLLAPGLPIPKQPVLHKPRRSFLLLLLPVLIGGAVFAAWKIATPDEPPTPASRVLHAVPETASVQPHPPAPRPNQRVLMGRPSLATTRWTTQPARLPDPPVKPAPPPRPGRLPLGPRFERLDRLARHFYLYPVASREDRPAFSQGNGSDRRRFDGGTNFLPRGLLRPPDWSRR
jgi:hypothetical protein